MKLRILCFLFFCIQKSFSQCTLVTPDSLRTVPHYDHIFQGDTVLFTTYGGLGDSSSWYALYGEECCVSRLDSNRTGTFTFVIWASDIFYSRIESYCDTTWGASVDIDAWPKISTDLTPNIPTPALPQGEGVEPSYDLLGRKISGDHRGFYTIKKRLFFK